MASTLPPDPYKALGVAKDAQLTEIRSAHRKLVLKCHPDKVQDAALKAIKQDEFQQVQQAYELLSDETRRVQYDDQVKLFELRKEMGRGNPTARSNPFEYEVRTAEPRANSYARKKPSPQSSPKVYSQTPPRSYEDVVYEEPRAMPRKSTSYESTDRKRTSTREEERRKHEEEERIRLKMDKERKHAAHSKEKKSRDKEKRRGTDEKHTRTAYVQDDEEDYFVPPRSSEKKSSRHRMEDEIRQREEDAKRERASIKEAPLASKWNKHKEYAGQYMQAARQKVAPATTEEAFVHPGMPRRAETFTAATYNVRHVAPQHFSGDEDAPRRSSARKEGRRSSETPPTRTRDKSTKGTRKRSPTRDAYIVEPPSPPPVRKPSLQTHSSAPPNSAAFLSSRDKPSRSKTQDYPRKDAIPPLPRAATFTQGDRGEQGHDRGGSRLKKTVDYSSAESDDSDSPVQPKRRSHSPPRRAVAPPEPTRYIIDNGRTVPITSSRHRTELRDLNEEVYTRERSESPRHRSRERPTVARNQSSDRPRAVPIRSQSQSYYPPDAPQIVTARPKMPLREGSSHRSTRGGSAGYFGEVKYAPSYGPDKVIYSSSPADMYRRGSDPRDHYSPHQRSSGRPEVYAA